jgi:hypothetical protein
MDWREQKPRRSLRSRLSCTTISVALHGALLFGIVSYVAPLPPPEETPITVTLFAPPPTPAPTDEPAAAAKPAEIRPPPKKAVVKERPPPPPEIKPILARAAPVVDVVDTVSDTELAGALTAGLGSGNGGGDGTGDGPGACNMVRRMQQALRKDPMVRDAVAQARRNGKTNALLVWKGDWVQSQGEEGKGLAAVRQAMMWEVAFAPAACRAQPVRGMVLITLAENSGAGRVAFGDGSWRWSDLLAR